MKNAAKRKKTNTLMYLASFLIPVIIVLLIYVSSDIWPFGTRCFLKTDLYHQYAPFTRELRTKLLSGGSLFYSWDIGMGINFLALIAYYLASPENLLVGLVPGNNVIEFMMISATVKIGLAGAAMTKYLKYRNGGRAELFLSVFGIFYALSGFVCAYYWNVMWLDCIILFPAVIYGAEALIREKRVFPYAAALSLCILTNYYISIMICIFLVLYFVMQNILFTPESFGDFVKRGLRFAAGSLLAGGAAAILLIPEVYALMQTASGSSAFPKTWTQYFSVLEMLERMLPAVKTEQALAHWPNIYAGSFLFVLVPLFVMSRRIRTKEKAVYLIAALVLLASFSINIFNYIWHGLHFPNSLPARQSFIFIFLVLFMGFRAWSFRKSFTKRETALALFIAVAFILYAQVDYDKEYFHIGSYYLALGMCVAVTLLIGLEKNKKLQKKAAAVVLLALCAVEVTINTCITSLSVSDRVFYLNDTDDTLELTADLLPGKDDFYRFNKVVNRTRNDGAWLGLPTVSIFSSVADAKMTDFMKKVGCEASTNAYGITGSTPLVDMLLGVKYGIYDQKYDTLQSRTFVSEKEKTVIYENDNTLSLGFMLPSALTEKKIFEGTSPEKVQNALAAALGAGHVLEEKPGSLSKGKKVQAVVPEDGEYYAYVTNAKCKKVTVTTPDRTQTCDNLDRKYFISLGELKKNDRVLFSAETEGEDVAVEVYRFDHEAFREAFLALSGSEFDIENRTDTFIEGTVTCDPESLGYAGTEAILCLTIPYDEGWKVTVDGEKAETERVLKDAFTGIRLSAGTHRITLSYMPRGFVPGALSSVICILLIILCGVFEKKHKKRTPRRAASQHSIY